MQVSKIETPVFFIGSGRSGTTVIFEPFARHPAIGGPLTYHHSHPTWIASGILLALMDNRFFQVHGIKKQHGSVILGNRLLPQHAEAYRFWNYYARTDFGRSYLLGCTASKEEQLKLRRVIERLLWWENRRRFGTKLTGPGRICYLSSIFPDARFVHIIRDGRAVTHSLMNVAFWRNGGGLQKPWWNPGFPAEYLDYWHRGGDTPHLLAALQWRRIIETTQQESTKLGPGQYTEVRYEDFVQSPHETLSRIFAFCDLNDSKRAHNYLNNHKPSPTLNTKYAHEMTAQAVAQMTEAMAPCLRKLDYLSG